MKPGSAYNYAQRAYLPAQQHYDFDGIDVLTPATLLGASSSPDLDNVEVVKGNIQKRKGYSAKGGVLDSAVIGIMQYTDDAGNDYLLASTLRHQYRYDAGTSTWLCISPRHATQYPASGGATVNAGADTVLFNTGVDLTTTTFAVGTRFLMSGSDGGGTHNTTHLITASSYASTEMTITTSTNLTVTTGTVKVQGMIAYTGDEDDTFDWAVGTDVSDGTVVVFTNGKDKPRRFTGGTGLTDLATELTLVTSLGTVTAAKTVAMFVDHLVIGNITCGGSSFPKSVAWSETGDLDDFGSTNSGDNLLADSRGDVKYITNIADRLAIYSDNSISIATFIAGTGIFSFEKVVEDVRLLGARTVANLGPYHIFASQENFFLFDGSRQLRTVGDKIFRTYRGQVNVQHGKRSFAFHDKSRGLVYWCIYLGDKTAEKNEHVIWRLEYDLFSSQRLNWTRESYTIRPRSMGWFSRTDTATWANVTSTPKWETYGGMWEDATRRAGYKLRATGGSTKVFVHDDTSFTDDGTAVSCYWQSKDFSSEAGGGHTSVISRWDEIEAELYGDEVDVKYSIDNTGYIDAAVGQALTGTKKLYRFPIDKSGRTISVRFENSKSTGVGFTLAGIVRVWYRPGGAY